MNPISPSLQNRGVKVIKMTSQLVNQVPSRGHAPCVLLLLATITIFGCGTPEQSIGKSESKTTKSTSEKKTSSGTGSSSKKTGTSSKPITAKELRKALKIGKTEGYFELEKGVITRVLLEETSVRDLSPLKNLPLKELRVNFTAISDISPVAKLPIEKLSLEGTPVKEISHVKSMPLNTLWLNKTKVTDLSPLKGKSLESLDISRTDISDLSVLKNMTSLKRLNLERCKVTDLTPLEGLPLQRLIFNPAKITKGLDVIRKMRTLQAIDFEFPQGRKFFTPPQFWQLYDAGMLPNG
jgi:Leucine-rich repeat (LRR) protein